MALEKFGKIVPLLAVLASRCAPQEDIAKLPCAELHQRIIEVTNRENTGKTFEGFAIQEGSKETELERLNLVRRAKCE